MRHIKVSLYTRESGSRRYVKVRILDDNAAVSSAFCRNPPYYDSA